MAEEQKVPEKKSLLAEFKEFLNEYKVIGLAVGFIMWAASTDLVKSIVSNLIMPIITPFIPGGEWVKATLSFSAGPLQFVFPWGALLNAVINFLILAWVVFLIAKLILKEEKVAKK